jgi:hypothetical protein
MRREHRQRFRFSQKWQGEHAGVDLANIPITICPGPEVIDHGVNSFRGLSAIVECNYEFVKNDSP